MQRFPNRSNANTDISTYSGKITICKPGKLTKNICYNSGNSRGRRIVKLVGEK